MAKICGSQNIISFPVTRFWPTSISHSTLKIFMWLNLKSSNVPQQPISAWNCFTSCSICYLWPPADITVLTLQTKLTSSCRKPPPSKVSTCAPHTCLIWAPKWFDNLSFAPDCSGKAPATSWKMPFAVWYVRYQNTARRPPPHNHTPP